MKEELENMKDDSCPCPIWGCPNRLKCDECTKSHIKKGHLNACGFYTILPTIETLIGKVDDRETINLIQEMLVYPNAKAYELANKMHDEMPIENVFQYLSSTVSGLRCNAHESLKRRTDLRAEYNPLTSGDELLRGIQNWKTALSQHGFLV